MKTTGHSKVRIGNKRAESSDVSIVISEHETGHKSIEILVPFSP
jgi:hypothetical protein